mgnify:CR=1 FL=1
MGCDIHTFVEYKLWNDGGMRTGCEIWVARDYTLFGLMAGVRGSDLPDVPPRGIPDGLSDEVQNEYIRCGTDAHTESWLTLGELTTVLARHPHRDMELARTLMNITDQQGRDPRLVFWFDN